MAVPEWIWFIFIFAFGCCIGSFLNVVIYRLPRDESLIKPPSACPACGTHIRFYDNIPLVSWLLLGAKCRDCKAPISPRYFVIELLTGLIFVSLFFLLFSTDLRTGIGSFLQGGWFVYLIYIILLAALIAASAIDLQLWVIPLSICWFATVVGLISSALGGYIIDSAAIRNYALLPSASAKVASLAAGAVIGLAISWGLLATGLIKRSYESENLQEFSQKPEEPTEQPINHRLEICREIIFLLPIIICSLAAYWLVSRNLSIRTWWLNFSQHPVIAGLLGSLWGYFVGCGVIWFARILGTLGFGKEAMGLGDVHLLGAAGTVIGASLVVVAFFIAPFFGLAWAGIRTLSKKTRQIPYGPFLSLGVFTVMIFHDRILDYLNAVF
ncbi:MAG: prepilin peptidase [Phycisphaerae bacterium]|nr:prepilin peptidase [Phycisphaerae bacterium]MDD5381407.1 prepilin peptidase [Phycisphaerae bacterium]